MESVDTPLSDSDMARAGDKASITSSMSPPKTYAANDVSPIKKPAKKPRLSSFDIFGVDVDSMDDIKDKWYHLGVKIHPIKILLYQDF